MTTAELAVGLPATFALCQAMVMKAYDTFGNAAKEGALKVVLTNGGPR